MTARLVEQQSRRAGASYSLKGGITTLGRAPDNTIIVERVGISRHQVEIRWTGKHYVMRDLGSTNGTWLNGQRLTAARRLRHGDVLSMLAHPALQLVFEDDETIETAAFASPAATDPGSAPASRARALPDARRSKELTDGTAQRNT